MNQRGNILIILVLLAALALGAVFYYYQSRPAAVPNTPYSTPITKQPQPTSTSSAEQIKLFQSKNLDFSINLSVKFNIEDKGLSINLLSQNGTIRISKNGTQYPNLKSHLDYFDKLRGVSPLETKEYTIDGYTAFRRTEKSPDGNRLAYYIMVDNSIYTFSTTSESLYNDLDQIAKSFRYTP